MYFVDVILPLSLNKLYTYRINEQEAHFLKKGMRIAVLFGKTKVYTAIAYEIHTNEPIYETKDIAYILDETPIVTERQLALWQWIAQYYMCTLGEVMKAALPTAFILESETIIEIDEKEMDSQLFSDDEWQVYEALHYKTALTGSEVSRIIPKKKTLKVLKSLVEKGAARVSEKIFEKYVPKFIKYVRLAPAYQTEAGLKEALTILGRAQKQKQLIMAYFTHINKEKTPLKAEMLIEIAKVSAPILKAVVEKGIFEEYYLQKDRVSFADDETSTERKLTTAQQATLASLKQQFTEKKTVLLQGVPASGKTELYISLINECLEKGQQALYLLPEIGLTVHLINRLKKHFGQHLSVYHSKYSTNERVEVWNNVLHNHPKAQVVVGVRSSVYLPFQNLGLVVIDEEHDSSYRQFDPAPRLQARDTAIMLSSSFGAHTLLGSATPSVESMYNVKQQKYGFAYLGERYANYMPPLIEIIDLKDKQHRKQMTGHFSDALIKAIQQTLSEGRQVLLYQNRRGYAPIVQCTHCGTVPQCPHCDVSLTFHQGSQQLRCHYCGYSIPMYKTCVACGSIDLKTKGVGTEQISKELSELFPNARTDRMDQDTTNGKYGYEKILSDFEQQETQILVGTQMNADAAIHSPDYRAYERSFQLLMQVSGRAGRSAQQGRVLIQTYNPQHPVLLQVLRSDFRGLYQHQIEERTAFSYPPLIQMIKITLRHTDFNRVSEGADWFAKALREKIVQEGVSVLGPEFPAIPRIRNEYIKEILVKIDAQKASIRQLKALILRTEVSLQSIGSFRAIRTNYLV